MYIIFCFYLLEMYLPPICASSWYIVNPDVKLKSWSKISKSCLRSTNYNNKNLLQGSDTYLHIYTQDVERLLTFCIMHSFFFYIYLSIQRIVSFCVHVTQAVSTIDLIKLLQMCINKTYKSNWICWVHLHPWHPASILNPYLWFIYEYGWWILLDSIYKGVNSLNISSIQDGEIIQL